MNKTRLKFVHLEVTSWTGISIGAEHYYGSLVVSGDRKKTFELNRKLGDRECFYLNKKDSMPSIIRWKAGQLTIRFNTITQLETLAIKIWKKKYPEYDALVKGRSSILDPQEPLDARKKAVFNKLHKFWVDAEATGGYEGDEKAMDKISDKYMAWAFGDFYK